jgi:choline dehydrogenase-like flavoprotein
MVRLSNRNKVKGSSINKIQKISMKKYDAIIVGSGAGGATAAKVLTKRGFSVAVMEKGHWARADDFLPYDELHFAEHKALTPDEKTDPLMWVNSKNEVKPVHQWWLANMVGGATNLWEANLPRYTDEDFSVLNYMRDLPQDVSMINWPWSYNEFQPFFERAEWDWGVSGAVNQSSAQEPTRLGYEYPMPPIKPHASNQFLLDVFRKHGMNPYQSARGINSKTYDGRPACPYCGFCQGFGCAVNDRSTAANTVLSKAIATGRCDILVGHNVMRLDHEKGKIKGVFYKTETNGDEKNMQAPIVIVSIQAIHSARLFLYSQIPDPNKLIGKYFTYHTKGSLEFVFKNTSVWGNYRAESPFQPRTGLGSLQLRDLYVIKDKGTYLTKGGKFSIYDPYTINTPIKAVSRCGHAPKKAKNVWGNDLVERMMELRNHGGASFSFTGETMSMEQNRIELHSDRKDPWGMPLPEVHYKHHQYDMDLSTYALDRVEQILTDAGGEVRLKEPQGLENSGYGHNHGSLRAGIDAGASVLDSDCQSWTVKGLYVLDSAWMPTAGASNPTLTQIANVYRVCDKIVK